MDRYVDKKSNTDRQIKLGQKKLKVYNGELQCKCILQNFFQVLLYSISFNNSSAAPPSLVLITKGHMSSQSE